MTSSSFFGSGVIVLTPSSANGSFFSFSTSDRSWGQVALQASQCSDQK
ncbi:MAG TPA: hypothetical protein VF384_19715 [Planctomycetota bacterium]